MIIEDCIEIINNVFPDHIYKQLEQECITLKDIMIKRNENIMISNYDYRYKLNFNDPWKNIFKKYFSSSYEDIYINFKSPNLSFDKSKNNSKNKKMDHFSDIFLMRQDNDKSSGGNLEIYDGERRIVSVPYQKNTFVIIRNKEKNLKYFITDRGISFKSMRYIIFN